MPTTAFGWMTLYCGGPPRTEGALCPCGAAPAPRAGGTPPPTAPPPTRPHRPLRPCARGQIGQPLAGRGWFVVGDVEHAGRLLLQGQDGSARRVIEMYPGYVAGAAPDQR